MKIAHILHADIRTVALYNATHLPGYRNAYSQGLPALLQPTLQQQHSTIHRNAKCFEISPIQM
jgi:hypothetical protein